MVSKVKNYIILIAALMVIFSNLAFAAVDVIFSPVENSVQRNGYFTLAVRVSSDENIEISGIDANVSYNGTAFVNPVLNSNIGDWMISVEDVSVPGKITYQKAGSDAADIFPVSAGVLKTIYTVEFQVSSAAELVSSSFVFQPGFINIVLKDGFSNVVNTYNTVILGALADTTPPDTTASHADGLYNSAISVALSVESSDRSNDLKEIRYRENGIANLSSTIYAGPIGFFSSGYLTFIGIDHDGNIEAVNTRNYEIDDQGPQISDLVISPNFCNAGNRIQISFTVNEVLLGGEPQSVRIGSYSASVSDNSYPDYEYYYDVTGAETEGEHQLQIVLRDIAGNQTTTSDATISFDFTFPTYYNPIFSALNPLQTSLIFEASELLDTARTSVKLSGNDLTFVSANLNTYTYLYEKVGDETTALVEVYGYDLAGNGSSNTASWNVVKVVANDIFLNRGEKRVTVDIDYSN